MGLKKKLARARYVYGWRLRYWWCDTRSGFHARAMLFGLGAVVVIVQMIRIYIAVALHPPRADQPKHAVIIWLVVLIIALIVAAAAVLLTPGAPSAPPTQSGDTPTTDDGQCVQDSFGTVWVDDSFLLAWKLVGTIPIKSSGGK